MSVSLDPKRDKGGLRAILTRGPLYVVVILLCFFWSLPTLGLLISSFRTSGDINDSGWWAVFSPQRENPVYAELKEDVDKAQLRVENREADVAVRYGTSSIYRIRHEKV